MTPFPKGTNRWLRAGALAVALLAACTATPPSTPKSPRGGKASPGVLATSPDPDVSASAAPGGVSPSPGASATPPLVGPIGTVSPSPSPAPGVSPTPLASAAPTLRSLVETKLLLVAQAAFVQAHSGLVGDKGANLLSNNGGSILSNNGSGIISNHGGSYHVLAADTIDQAPAADELVFADRHWLDGTRTLQFTRSFDVPDDHIRRIEFNAAGLAYYELNIDRSEAWPDGSDKTTHKRTIRLDDAGHFYSGYAYTEHDDEAAKLVSLALDADSARVRDPAYLVSLDVPAFSVDMPTGTGAFRYVFPDMKLVETGTLKHVTTLDNDKISFSFGDPLGYYDGESKVETSEGKLLFTKTRESGNGSRQRTYDLQDGLVISLSRTPTTNYTGTMSLNGAQVATVGLENRVNGSTVFTVTFPDAPASPLVIGYGLTEPAAGAPTPTPAPTATPWEVAVLAGATTAGDAIGAGPSARFNTLGQIVASRVTPGRFYLADANNHRIRTLTLAGGAATIANYAGSGQPGLLDGPLADALFQQPLGLAVGADDTLYVTDAANHDVRRVSPAGQVDTLAGDGQSGHLDGPGATAQFKAPLGIAVGADTTVYVGDFLDHRIRRIHPDGTVDTLAGDGTEGFLDGPAAAARFNRPMGMLLDAQGRLCIADRLNFRIRRFDPTAASPEVTTIAGCGVLQKAFVDGPALTGGMNGPFALTLGADGTVYTARFDVKAIGPDGQLRTFAGTTKPGTADGSVREAGFGDIYGLAMTADGSMLVSEGQRVRIIRKKAP